MKTLNLTVRYRPLRIGWCVRNAGFKDLRRALRLTHTLWGGRYNPVIPVTPAERADDLVRLFRVDALYAASDDAVVLEFVEKYSHIRWPFEQKSLFLPDTDGQDALLLDFTRAVHRLRKVYADRPAKSRAPLVHVTWEPEDPLADVFLATFGGFPKEAETGLDYASVMKESLAAEGQRLAASDHVPADAHRWITPSRITTLLLERARPSGWSEPGLYFGDATDFNDIVDYWNLRASNIDLVFYDPKLGERLGLLRSAYTSTLREHLRKMPEGQFAVWSRGRSAAEEFCDHAPDSVLCTVSADIWNGLNLKPPPVFFRERSVAGSVTGENGLQLTFRLPQAPLAVDAGCARRHVVVSVAPSVDVPDEKFRFRPPCLPELNEHLTRSSCTAQNCARAEPGGLGIVTRLGEETLTLNAFNVPELVEKVFGAFGMEARITRVGRLCARLIRQMGGLAGCRVFKIRGARDLIAGHGSGRSFTKGEAVRTIGRVDSLTGKPDFARYEDLCISGGSRSEKTSPEDAFACLVEKGALRVGVELSCPHCERTFWRGIDGVASSIKCEYCGNDVNISSGLEEPDWRYRPSGLFGRSGQRQAILTAALTLHELDRALHREMMYVTAMSIRPAVAAGPCRTDFVVLLPARDERVRLVLGRCCASGEITQEDVAGLVTVAAALPEDRFQVFLLFSKPTAWTGEEIERCRSARMPEKDRVILLSDRELEPRHMYELADRRFHNRGGSYSLSGMARATRDIYFEPRPR